MTSEEHDYQHCLELLEKFSAYVDNELDMDTCQEIEEHIKKCLPCHVCLQTLKRTIDLCKRTQNQPVPPSFSKKLQALIESIPKPTSA
jgi:anti-sigma factor RsiW